MRISSFLTITITLLHINGSQGFARSKFQVGERTLRLVSNKNYIQTQRSSRAFISQETFPYQSVALSVTSSNDDITWQFNPFYAALWAGFLLFGFVLSPGSFDSPLDKDILNAFFSDPVQAPGVNKLFVIIFSLLGVMPMVISSLLFAQGSEKGLPATPFALASMSGFFALGTSHQSD